MNNENGTDAVQEATQQSHTLLVKPRYNFGRSVHIARLIHKFGGAKKLSKICNCTTQNIYMWTDHVSAEPAWLMLAHARRMGREFDDVTLEMLRPDLDFGRTPSLD